MGSTYDSTARVACQVLFASCSILFTTTAMNSADAKLRRMNLAELTKLAARQAPRSDGATAHYLRPLKGLGVFRQQHPSSFEAAIYDPVICLVLQGRKEM